MNSIVVLFNILVNLWEREILPQPLIEYHKSKLFIRDELDLICMKYVICTLFIQLELRFTVEGRMVEYIHIFKNSVIL